MDLVNFWRIKMNTINMGKHDYTVITEKAPVTKICETILDEAVESTVGYMIASTVFGAAWVAPPVIYLAAIDAGAIVASASMVSGVTTLVTITGGLTVAGFAVAAVTATIGVVAGVTWMAIKTLSLFKKTKK